MSDDLTPAQALYQRDVLALQGRMDEAGALTERAVEAKGSYEGAFDIPQDAEAAEAELARIQSNPAFVESLFDHSHPLYRANSARRDQLMRAAYGGADDGSKGQAAETKGKLAPEDYTIAPEPGQTWQDFDSELAGDAKGWAAAMQLPQPLLDQVVFAYNTAAKDGPPDAETLQAMTADCEQEMLRRYGDRLPSLLEGFRSTLAKLPASERQRVEDLINSSGLGSSIPFVGAVLGYIASQQSGGGQ